jgi:hypothetical protein
VAGRTHEERRLWLNDKNAVVGMSNINPLLQKKATPKPFKATVPAAFKPKHLR